ncbi:hypothetical protein BYT27DRAFT_6648718 [Phlegmacium glaucopus]|nr:hypothetical protein BYT27DRAFT_6648718 [Phlegmacium glaucopus]
MGKWTPNYVDEVLHAKISNMVSGAIRRVAVEKETSISYESFVNELDTGDSFTLSLVDILVKEVAHRRTRATLGDRRLLAENTIKGLRTLANNNRSYPNRVSVRHARRTVNLTDYLAAPPNEMELDEDDELEIQDSVLEGARVNSELYDAYDAFVTNPWPSSNARRITASPSPASEEWPLPQPLRSPTSTSRPWPMPIASSTLPTSTLSRQASLRRAARSRMVDFNDFTHRRRSSNRDSVREPSREPSGTHPNATEDVTEPRDGSTSAWSRSHGRRFFPFSRTRQHETMWSEVSDSLSADASDESGHFMTEPMMPTLFDAPTASDSYSRASPDAESRDDIPIRAPRWRRRNMRAPELQSMLSRHASPIIIYEPTGSSAMTPPARQDENQPPAPPREEPVAYPTPGSSENENLS